MILFLSCKFSCNKFKQIMLPFK